MTAKQRRYGASNAAKPWTKSHAPEALCTARFTTIFWRRLNAASSCSRGSDSLRTPRKRKSKRPFARCPTEDLSMSARYSAGSTTSACYASSAHLPPNQMRSGSDSWTTLLRLRFTFSQFRGASFGKLAQDAVANNARVLGVAFIANGFVCLPVALFDPSALLGSKQVLR